MSNAREQLTALRKQRAINGGPLQWDEGAWSEPLTCEFAVLNALVEPYGSRTQKRLCIKRHEQKAYIECLIFNGGYTGDELSDSFKILVDFETATGLITRGLVDGVPYWGYTADDEFVRSEHGKRHLLSEVERRKTEDEESEKQAH